MMKEQLVFGAVVVIVAGIVAYLFHDVINTFVILPISQVLVMLRIYLSSIPQFFFWIILLVMLFILVGRTFSGLQGILKSHRPITMRRKMGPVESWEDWLMRATGGKYFESKLAGRVSDLAISVLSFRHELPPDKILKNLESGDIALPPKTQDYINRGIEKESWGSFRHHAFEQFSLIKSREQYRRVFANVSDVVEVLHEELKG